MRLKALILRNFIGYKGEVRIPIHPDMTAFIGKNDVGKSTILDALGIFFDSPLVKFDTSDLCVYSEDKEVRIGCVFEDRKSTRLNSSHVKISYAVFCLKKKKTK